MDGDIDRGRAIDREGYRHREVGVGYRQGRGHRAIDRDGYRQRELQAGRIIDREDYRQGGL